ncbi:DUF6338 family protein [Nitrosopumilus sp.]|uniref:DUF6338 family protein n=1 Tax=Nitrosopumilus sp. TaxID=2024843 RepID=UPI003D0B45F0
MALPSLADALIVVILLIPGFITFTIIRWLGHYGNKQTEFKITISSFSLSMVIIFFYTLITGITSLDILRDKFFIPTNFLILFGITLAVGFGVGMILRRRRSNRFRLDTWEKTATEYDNAPWIIVITIAGTEYKGRLFRLDVEDKKDIVIVNPKQIIRDEKNEITSEIEFGEKMFFHERDIARIAFLT